MPPKKKTKATHVPSPSPASLPKTPASAEEQAQDDDPWTDEEEIGLFKGLIKWKPTGIHKHFRLLALHQFMLSHGYIHPEAEHTTPAGIWRKLEQIYNLGALDEREDARQLDKLQIPGEYRASRSGSEQEGSDDDDEDADAYSEAANKIENEDFDLGGTEFAELKWARRLPGKPGKGESPAVLSDVNMAEEAPVRFTPSFSIEPSENATPTTKRGRGRASATVTKKKAPAPPVNKRRSARQAGSVADEAEEAEDVEQQSAEEEASEEAESEESTPAPRTSRNAKAAKDRANASTGRGRGRGRRARGK